MSAVTDSRTVTTALRGILANREKNILARAHAYAGQMMKAFHDRQPSGQGVVGKYWTNQTSEAANAVFSEVYRTKTEIGFFIAHGIKYGIYLELANNRQNQALAPLIDEFGAKFIVSVQKLMEG